jgi:uncharacterized LabA/DUF88 family protein
LKKKTAILIDGAFLNKKIRTVADPIAQADRVVKAAHACLDQRHEDLYRIFYYDCPPFDGVVKDLTGNPIDFAATPQNKYQKALLARLAKRPFVAVRHGALSCLGWVLKETVARRIKAAPLLNNAVTIGDFTIRFQQKGVDMRIGLDVALLAIDRLVERVVLVTADSDFIPAMKLARREGVQVVLVSLANKAKPQLLDHADIYRKPNLAGI